MAARQQHIAACLPGQPLYAEQDAHAAAVDKVQRGKVDDQALSGPEGGTDRSRGSRGADNVQIAAQRHYSVAADRVRISTLAMRAAFLPEE